MLATGPAGNTRSPNRLSSADKNIVAVRVYPVFSCCVCMWHAVLGLCACVCVCVRALVRLGGGLGVLCGCARAGARVPGTLSIRIRSFGIWHALSSSVE